jgi:AraC-like DNA-binding protein
MSLRTCPKGHETCWPRSCPVCAAYRPVKPRGPKPAPRRKGRKSLVLTAEGKTLTLAQWSDELGYSKTYIRRLTKRFGDFGIAARCLGLERAKA